MAAVSGDRLTGPGDRSAEDVSGDRSGLLAPTWWVPARWPYRGGGLTEVVAGLVASGRPRWFPDPFLWVVGCTHNGMPSVRGPVRNVVGASMIFRRDALVSLGGFTEEVGRVGLLPEGCEETEMCIRARQRIEGASVIFEPLAVVDHLVPAERATLGYFFSRCLAEGRSKAAVSRLVGSSDGLSEERRYTRETLPAAVAAGLRDAVRGDLAGLARAAMVLAGLATTAAGYASGRLRRR